MSCPKVTPGGSDGDDETPHFSSMAVRNSTDMHPDTLSHPDLLTTEVDDKEETVGVEEKESGSGERSFEHKELSQDGISEILDMECGEPMMSQHLRIDFNPLEGVDDSEYLLKKCMNFWKLVEGSKVLQELKALPEKNIEERSVKSSESEENFLLHGDFPPARLGAIEVMEEKGRAVDDCLVNKIKRRYCEEGSGDYFVDLPPSKPGVMTKWATPQKSTRPKHPTSTQREEVSQLCQELEQWDMNHPKSMEPPNHGPPHTYAVMQRNY